jgi:hypothetical protein
MERTPPGSVAEDPQSKRAVRKTLLFCGILAPLVYVGADILAAVSWKAYSYADQMISELMAIGAPTRPLLVRLFTVHNLLVIAFGAGLCLSAGRKRALRVTGILLAISAAVGQAALLFAPMHLRGAEKSLTDTMHIVATGAIVLLTLLSIGCGAKAGGRGFRLYSIATILVLLFCGALSGLQAPRVGANLPTPGFGILERVNIYGSMLWILALAAGRLRARDPAG